MEQKSLTDWNEGEHFARVNTVLRKLAKVDAKLPDGTHAFDPWPDDAVVFAVGNRTITAGDLRNARKCVESD